MAHKDSLVPRLMRAARDGTPVQVYGSGRQVRDFVHVDDVVAGLFVAWRTGHVGPLVVGSGRSLSVLDVVAAAEKVTGEALRLEYVPAKAAEMPAVIVSVERARALGYEPSVALEDGIASVWDDFRVARR
jgi:UDP-glucose 4-epimerase